MPFHDDVVPCDASLHRAPCRYRYIELEDQHEALFPAIATTFQLTVAEVERIQQAQQQHAHANSLWGRTLSAGSVLISSARETARELQQPREPPRKLPPPPT